jgi:hypothetical protein|tara:strand:- start:234 stop:566 length:333 start_codon:yes stop_codon:yes gene_type:complete
MMILFVVSNLSFFLLLLEKENLVSKSLLAPLGEKHQQRTGFFLRDEIFFFSFARREQKNEEFEEEEEEEESLSLCRVFLTGVFLRVGSCCNLSKKKTRKSRENTGKKQQH